MDKKTGKGNQGQSGSSNIALSSNPSKNENNNNETNLPSGILEKQGGSIKTWKTRLFRFHS